jgi:hypothetical protein
MCIKTVSDKDNVKQMIMSVLGMEEESKQIPGILTQFSLM